MRKNHKFYETYRQSIFIEFFQSRSRISPPPSEILRGRRFIIGSHDVHLPRLGSEVYLSLTKLHFLNLPHVVFLLLDLFVQRQADPSETIVGTSGDVFRFVYRYRMTFDSLEMFFVGVVPR